MIAIALAGNPSLLIADEPTTGLDTTTQAAILDLILGHAAERRMATLLITHDLGLARAYADRIVVMHAGQSPSRRRSAALFTAPRHPYSAALIVRTPTGSTLHRRCSPVPGSLPDLADDLPACRFASAAIAPARLPRRAAAAGSDEADTRVACWHPLAEGVASERAAAGRAPEQALPGAGQRGALLHAVDDVSLHVARRRKPGPGGRVGLRQVHAGAAARAAARPTEGRIVFDGDDLAALPRQRFARTPQRGAIQMVFQDPTDSLNPRFTARDTIREPCLSAGGHGPRRSRARVDEVAAQVGLPPELLSRFPHQLSGGQKARVGIARALAPRPELLILDEPTAALDVSVQAVVLQLLDRLRRELGLATLFVSHDLNVVRLLTDRVAVMYLGKIVEMGPSAQRLRPPAHPYTQALVSAMPGHGPRIRLDGEVQSPIDPPPQVCRFASRCPRCRTAAAARRRRCRAPRTPWPATFRLRAGGMHEGGRRPRARPRRAAPARANLAEQVYAELKAADARLPARARRPLLRGRDRHAPRRQPHAGARGAVPAAQRRLARGRTEERLVRAADRLRQARAAVRPARGARAGQRRAPVRAHRGRRPSSTR